MAVVAVTEIWKGRQATRDMGNVREYTRTFLVQCTELTDGPFTVGNTPVTGIPPLYSSYVDLSGAVDLGALVVKYRPRQMEEPLYWEVEVQYSSDVTRFQSPRQMGQSGRSGKAEQAAKGQQDQNPLNRPPVIKIGDAKFQKPCWSAINLAWSGTIPPPKLLLNAGSNQPVRIANSAGSAYDPIPEIDDSRLRVTIDRNEAIANFAQIAQYKDATNADTFWGMGPGCVKVGITCESAFENNLFYWKKTYTLDFRPETWCTVLLDQGMTQLSYDQNPRQTPIKDHKTGAYYGKELALNGFGQPLAELWLYADIPPGVQTPVTVAPPGCDPYEGLDVGLSF